MMQATGTKILELKLCMLDFSFRVNQGMYSKVAHYLHLSMTFVSKKPVGNDGQKAKISKKWLRWFPSRARKQMIFLGKYKGVIIYTFIIVMGFTIDQNL